MDAQPDGSSNSTQWKKVKISEANAWRMVSNTTTDRDTAVDHTPRLLKTTLNRLVWKKKKGN
jgi:hypothetical protein